MNKNLKPLREYIYTDGFKKSKGITLVALIVTIIILLILAGITISQLTESGLFGKAKLAKDKQENAQLQENQTLTEYEQNIEQYIKKNNNYNDFKKWISYANLENKYNSISDILNNSTDLNIVMNKKECVDYMIKSTGTIMQEIANSETAIREIGNSDYAASKVINDETWFATIQNSEYADVFDEKAVKIPELTDNTSNGIVTGTPLYSTAYKLYYPFTEGTPNVRSGANIWCPYPYENSWIAYEFNIENNINIYKLKFNSFAEKSNSSRWFFPKKYVLQCKVNDGEDNELSNWTDCSPVFEISDITSEYNLVTNFSEKTWWKVTNYFKSNVYGKKFRLYVYKSSGSDLDVNQLQIYGRY